jgi:predicted nucleic acid-binding protein
VIVIDAGVALAWILDEKENREAVSVLDYVVQHGALVPGNFQSEVAHALLNAWRREIISETDVSSGLAELLALPISAEFPDPHVIIAVGKKHKLTGYDAAYLALATQSELPLATGDKTLRAAARSERVLWSTPERS